ncbi:uncharacterized protein LOC141666113 [Apium graveolens]|uniref:uncharacterized protein LOC141666113 n=1 Tax=Apium graveolens TaxID=4045 RepID=UPI003D7AA7CF
MEAMKSKEGTVALSYPMLTKSNYTVWAMKMRAFMRAHGIWDAIEPTDPKVAVDEKVDRVALAGVYQAIPDDILLAVAEKTTAKSTWEAIKMMCQGAERVKTARIQTMKTVFETLRMKETEGIDEFSMTLSGLVTNIRALGKTVQESHIVKKLLMAVPNRFLQITSAMEQFGKIDEMSFEEAVGSLKAHEEKLQGKVEKGIGHKEPK